MRILLCTGVYPPAIGGPATFARTLAHGLKRAGHEPIVLTYGDASTMSGEGWPVHVVSSAGGVVVRYVRYAWHVWRLGRSCDALYVSGPISDGVPVTCANALLRKPVVMKIVGDAAWESAMQAGTQEISLDAFVQQPQGGRVGVFARLERWTAARAARVVTPSVFLKRIVEAWGVPSDRVQVVHNAIPALPAPTQSRDALRASFGVEGKRVVLTVVRAVAWKGVDFLIDVLRDLPLEMILVSAGDGPMLGAWQAQVEAAGLADRVRLLGRVNRQSIADWYACADAFVLATGYEGFPHVVLEAAAAGLPCFVSDRGGNPETLSFFPDQVTVVPYRDREAWVRALSGSFMRFAATAPDTLSEPAMLQAYEHVLQDVVRV